MNPVGRTRELAQIARTLAAVEEGFAPKVALVEGAAGLGKSTLLGAACNAARAEGWLVVLTTCHAVQSALPLSAMRAILRALLDALGDDRERYASGLDTVVGTGAASETAAKGVGRLLEGITLDYKVAIAVDDAQWADADSLRALAELTVALAERRVAILLAKRPEASDAHLPLPIETVVPVLPLGDADAATVVRLIAPSASEELVLETVRHAGGHPLDLVALSNAILRDEITDPADLAANRRALIARNVRSEPPDLREFLQLCSLIDGPVERRVLVALFPDADALDDLIARAAVRYVHADGSRVTFVHALIGEAVRETVAVQTPFRRRIVAAIEAVPDRFPEDYEVLAEQLAECGDRAGAFATLSQLAAEARQRNALRLRANACARALQYAEPPSERSVEFYTGYADALFQLDRDADAAAMSEAALESIARSGGGAPGHLVARLVLAQIFSDQPEKARISYKRFSDAVTDPIERSHVLSAGLWFALTDDAFADSGSIEAFLEALGPRASPLVRIRAAGFRAFRLAMKGDYPGAADLLEGARRIAEESRSADFSHWNLGVVIPSMFVTLFEFGTRAFAAYLERSHASVEDQSNLGVFRGLMSFLEGKWAAAEALTGAALDRSPSTAIRRRLLSTAAAIAALRGVRSEHQGAIDREIAQFLDVQCRGGAAPLAVWWAASPAAETRAARTILRSVVKTLSEPSDLGLDMPTYMPKIALVAAAHRLDEEGALRIIADGKLWCPQTPWHVAHQRAAQDVARTLLGERVTKSPSADDCEALGLSVYADLVRSATAPSAEASARLSALGVTWLVEAKAEKKPAARATARELQVAELVAAGKSNREIAETLVLSLRTVEAHIANLFNKLGVTSRTQLVAWHYRFHEGV